MGASELVLVLVSAALHAGWNMVAKGSARPVGFMAWLGLAYVPVTLLCLPWLDLQLWALPVITALGLSMLVHAAAVATMSFGYESGDLSVVYPIARSAPALLPLAAWWWLGEPLSMAGAVGIAAVMVGMWLVQTGGRMARSQLLQPAALWAYGTLLASVLYSVLDKWIMGTLHDAPWTSPMPRALAFYLVFASGTSIVYLPVAWRVMGGRPLLELGRRELLPILGGSLATLLGYVLVLEALRTSAVSYVVAVRQISVVMAVGLAMAVLRERPSPARLLGAAATVVGVVVIALWG